ncbi:MAG TPA: reverse transcriptase [Desulfobulbaceae bacterium]|nr:MAG: hypothetical protein A2520_07385 [Deltaproteobacteria bacterium RIFOXYD12_FULL_53_23]HCC54718.1 reverse transcriptase [Desulfobulbaceae bacterium]
MMASLFTFENLYRAWLDCRRRKRGKTAALAFETKAEEELLDLVSELADRTYRPRPSFCFVARNDKYREVFAAQFRDRVVHHLLVRELEKIWEPVFIHDSYACRRGKGTHAAVNRLQTFMRRATANNTLRAWFLQLDIRSFFPSIDRALLLELVRARLHSEELQWLAEVVIAHDPAIEPMLTCSPEKWRNIPPGKSLFGAPFGKGLPIGNLTSQFLANVYLNPLDQFVKHQLKAKYYLRYVDDMILVHEKRQVLEEWLGDIESFLQNKLLLELHPTRRIIQPVGNGADFVGYIVRPTHLLVRRRTVGRCKEALARHAKNILGKKGQNFVLFPPEGYLQLQATIQSYLALFRHASAKRLRDSLFVRHPWLGFIFERQGDKLRQRWDFPGKPANLKTQYGFFRRRFRGVILFQVGSYFELFDRDAVWASKTLATKRLPVRPGFYARCGVHRALCRTMVTRLVAAGRHVLVVAQSDMSAGLLKARRGVALAFPGHRPVTDF